MLDVGAGTGIFSFAFASVRTTIGRLLLVAALLLAVGGGVVSALLLAVGGVVVVLFVFVVRVYCKRLRARLGRGARNLLIRICFGKD